jgi:HK97 family phage portal protein
MDTVISSPSSFPSNNPLVYSVYGQDFMPATAINEFSALQLPAMWSGIRWISSTMAAFPKRVIKRDGEVSIPIHGHPVARILNTTINPYTFPMQIWETWQHHATIFGNGYIVVQRDPKSFKPMALFNVMPETVTPFRVLDGEAMGQWYLCTANGKRCIIPAIDMLHLPGLGFDGLQGYPIVLLMQEALEFARNAQQFGSRFFKKGTQIQGSIEMPATATQSQIDMTKALLRERHSGMQSDYGYMFTIGGAVVRNNTIPPEQSQLIQTMKFSTTQLCQILRVPPHILFETDNLKANTIEAMGRDAVTYSLGEWLTKSSQIMTRCLLTDVEINNGLIIELDVESLLRGDSAAYTDQTLKLLNGGVITANESRKRHNFAPVTDPEADQLRIPVSFPLAGQIGIQPGQPGLKPNHSRQDLQPIIANAFRLIETKTEKAFSNKAGKPAAELVPWGNVFAEEQAGYVKAMLQPVADVLAKTGEAFPLDTLAARYADSIKRRAAGGIFGMASEILAELEK